MQHPLYALALGQLVRTGGEQRGDTILVSYVDSESPARQYESDVRQSLNILFLLIFLPGLSGRPDSSELMQPTWCLRLSNPK